MQTQANHFSMANQALHNTDQREKHKTKQNCQPATMKKFHNYLYNYSDLLGQGNFSKVYKGHHQLTQEQVAIKIVELSSLTSAKLEELLNSEIQILRKMNHPNVLKCYEAFSSKRNCYIVTQLCQDGDLGTLLDKKKYFQEQEIFNFAIDILQALKYLSSKDIVHRDVKICNIFLKDGHTKLADFGFAKIAKCNFVDASIGSPIYMSPQGFIKNIYGPKTDVWALGIILFELAHGYTPSHQCKTQAQLKQSINKQLKQQDLHHSLSKQFKNLILNCLKIDEKKRASIEDLDNNPWIINAREQVQRRGFNYYKQLAAKIYPNRNKSDRKVQLKIEKKPILQISTKMQHLQSLNSTSQNLKKVSSIFRPSQNFLKLTNNGSFNRNKQLESTQINHNIMTNYARKKQEASFHKKANETMNFKLRDYSNKDNHTAKKKTWTQNSNVNESINYSISIPFSPPSRIVKNQSLFPKAEDMKDNASLYTTFNPKTIQLSPSNTSNIQQLTSYKSKSKFGEVDNIPSTNSIGNSQEQFLPGKIDVNQCIGILHYCRLVFKFTTLLKQYQVKSNIKPEQSPILAVKNKTLQQSNSRTSLHFSIRHMKQQQKKRSELVFAEWVMLVLGQVYKKIMNQEVSYQNSKNVKEYKIKAVIAEYLNKYSKQLGVTCVDSQKKQYKFTLNLTHEDINKEIGRRLHSIDHEISIINVARGETKPSEQLQKLLILGYYALTVQHYTKKLAQCQTRIKTDHDIFTTNTTNIEKQNSYFKNFSHVDDIEQILDIKKFPSKLTIENFKAYQRKLKPDSIKNTIEKQNRSSFKEYLTRNYSAITSPKVKTENSSVFINLNQMNMSANENKKNFDYQSNIKSIGLR